MIAMQRITAASMGPDLRLHLAFGDGASGSVDFGPVVARGGVAQAIAAAPEAVRIGTRGRSVEWPDGAGDVVDFCADALRLEMDAAGAKAAAE